MPYIPNVVGNNTLDAATLTAIGGDVGVGVEVVTDNVQTLYTYGNAVLAETSLTNRWLAALVNKIVRSRLVDNMYKDRLSPAFKGVLDIGDGVEEVLCAPAGVKRQGPGGSAEPGNPFAANMPDVYVKWHVTNANMVYSVRVSRKRLRAAFNSFGALDAFVQYLVDSLYNGYEWDCQILTKFKLAQKCLAAIGAGTNVPVANPITGDGVEFLAEARTYAELFKWMSDKYNEAGVPVPMRGEKLYITMTAEAGAHVDVKDLAAAFNLTYAEFIGRRMPIDSFSFTAAEKARIEEITGLGAGNFPFNAADEANLETVIGLMYDIDLLQIYDQHEPELWTNSNGAEAEENFWLHCDRIVSLSPFANCVVFTAEADDEEVIVTP